MRGYSFEGPKSLPASLRAKLQARQFIPSDHSLISDQQKKLARLILSQPEDAQAKIKKC